MASMQCIVRYTDQNPRGTVLLFGGAGCVTFHADRVEVSGMETHRGAGSALADTAMALNPLTHAVNTLAHAREAPRHVILPVQVIDSVLFDPRRLRFAVIARPDGDAQVYRQTCWAFALAPDCPHTPGDVADAMKALYPRKYREERLPIEHRRLLLMFAVLVALALLVTALVRFNR